MTSDAFAYPPRLLARDEAARYMGISPSQLERLVADRVLPSPKRMQGRVLWDRIALDIAAGDLPDRDGSTFQAKLEATRK